MDIKIQNDYRMVLIDKQLKNNEMIFYPKSHPKDFYQNLAEDHGRKPVGESVPLKQMKEIV